MGCLTDVHVLFIVSAAGPVRSTEQQILYTQYGNLSLSLTKYNWFYTMFVADPDGLLLCSELIVLRLIHIPMHMCQGLNSHYFHIIGDGHQPTSRGLYTHYKDSY